MANNKEMFMQIAHIKAYNKTSSQIYVDKGSPLANPYKKYYGQKTGNASVQAYRAWLWKKLRAQDKSVMRLMDLLHQDSTLLCYCEDDSCHAPIIIKAWNWLKTQGLVDKKTSTTPAKRCGWTLVDANHAYEEGETALY